MRRPPATFGKIPCEGGKERVFALVYFQVCLYLAMLVPLILEFPARTPDELHSTGVKAGFHVIADDRRRSRIANRRSQTIAKTVVFIWSQTIASRLLHTFRTAEVSKFNTGKKSQQTKWRTSREKFCCKQIYYSFSKPIFKFSWYISLRIQKVAFSIASDNDHTQFLCCGRLRRRRRK